MSLLKRCSGVRIPSRLRCHQSRGLQGNSVAHFVRYFKRSTGEEDQLEHFSAEDLADAIFELNAGGIQINPIFVQPDQHVEIRFREEAEGHANAIIEVRRSLNEFLTSIVNEADIQRWGNN